MKTTLCAIAALCIASAQLSADEPLKIDYEASVLANASSGHFAPYMIGSWNYGRINAKAGLWHDGLIKKETDMSRRFSWGAGFEYLLGYGSAADYSRYEAATDTWSVSERRQSPARIQQLYGEIKYRSVYLLAGMKERHSRIVDDTLSSGDLTRSNNARPIPGIAAGFLDFVDIPLTNGWVQIDGEIMYGKFTDSKYKEQTFNYYSGNLATDLWYIYRRCYFRTKPSQPLSLTIGMQAAGQFGGRTVYYTRGKVRRTEDRGFKFKDIFTMFFPSEGSGQEYYDGNSLGSWDVKLRYRFNNGSSLSAYFEGPWEDGSGIGRQNGFDGLWGLQYNFAQKGIVSKVLFEYFDFTNQSGPIHYSPEAVAGSSITDGATGGDDYYNNVFYGPYSNYGMSIGSPFVVSPLYNLDGSPNYCHNKARGFHAAAEGEAGAWSYKLMISYQQAGGQGRIPAYSKLHDTSALAKVQWLPSASIPGLRLTAEAAFDKGNLRGNNFGVLAGISYCGSFTFGK